jgi:hypothetical protein
MKDQILKIAKVKSEKEFYKKYPSEEAFMKAHGKAFKKAAMGSKMVNDQLHQLTDFGNPPIAQYGIGMKKKPQNFNNYLQGTNQAGMNPDGSMKQVGDAFNNASMAKMSGQQMASDMSSQFATPSADKLLGKNDINSGVAKTGGFDAGAAGMAGLQGIGKVIGGIEAIAAQKKAQKKSQQSAELSGLSLQAQQTMEKPKNQYVRPEDSLVQPGQLGNPYGTGTNYLQAQNGTMIGGNPTEIQNTYTPGDLYSDLGYEPLEEAYKQYRRGGNMPKAEFGEYFQDSGQAQIGSAVGGAVAQGFGLPPAVGELVGKVAGNLLGGAKDARKLQAQKDKTALNTSMMGFEQARSQGPLNANLEHGGWVSHDWQPQVFAKFGEYDAKDLLKPPHDADMLRSGGHLAQVGYTAPSAEALYTGRPDMPQAQLGLAMAPLAGFAMGANKGAIDMFQNSERANQLKSALASGMMNYGGKMALGGELQIGDGGYAETLSYNPNLPGGEIGMFRGASHDNGGIQTQYGENGVEVEGGEPFTILEDNGSEDGNNLEGGGSKENLVVFGNIKINKEIADLMGDPKAKGKKFKTYIADVAKNDAKQLKTIQKGLDLIEEYDGNSSYDKLGMNSGMANLMGAKAQQKINADKIKEAGIVQDSIHKVANEYGVKSDKLAEGKLEKETDPSMVAKDGTKLKKAQKGQSYLNGRLLDPKDPRDAALIKQNMDDVDKDSNSIKDYFDRKNGKQRPNLDNSIIRRPSSSALSAPNAPQRMTRTSPEVVPYRNLSPFAGSTNYLYNEESASGFNPPNFGGVSRPSTVPYNEAQPQFTRNFKTPIAPPYEPSSFGGSSNYVNKPTASGFVAPIFGGRPSIVPYKEAQPEFMQKLKAPSAPQTFSRSSSLEDDSISFDQEELKSLGKDKGKDRGKGLEKYGPTLLSYLENYLRPSNANDDLPPDQLYPEYYAMAMNQLEPVQAQQFQPMLDTPYDISFNDQINAIDSQSRAAIRAAGSNPAAQAMIMAQSIEAKNKLFGESNRMNQANKMAVYDKNRAAINDAKLKNLAINDQQYVRQSEGKSKTKAQTQAALSSIADKTAKQRATNRKLAIMENMYGFRFSPSGRAINMNAPAQFNMSGNPFGRAGNQQGLSPGLAFTYDDQQQIVGTRRIPKSGQPSMDELDDLKNGGKTSKKKARNSSIVKALKNL